MNKIEIAMKKMSGLVVEKRKSNLMKRPNFDLVLTLNANIFNLGFMFSSDLIDALATLDRKDLISLSNNLIPVLSKMVGAHVIHRPMYPNFPKQVMEASDVELFYNALRHYHLNGEWLPEYEEVARKFDIEETGSIKTINLKSENDFQDAIKSIVMSNDSITGYDKNVLEWAADNGYMDTLSVVSVPYKETQCLLASIFLRKNLNISGMLKTGLDVMRVYAYLSGGDISLTEKFKFKSLPRKTRRKLVNILEDVLTDEDLKGRENLWVKMAHALHVGEYSNYLYVVFKNVRENNRRKLITSFNSKVEDYISKGDYERACEMLSYKPSLMVRRFSELFDKSGYSDHVLMSLKKCLGDVPNRVLIQFYGYVKSRRYVSNNMFVVPKNGRAVIVNKTKTYWSKSVVDEILSDINEVLIKRYSDLKPLGRVYVDESLMDCPLPTQMRSASDALKVVAKGTKIPMNFEGNTLRLFVYWKGYDIDLSAAFHDENYEYMDHISYTNIRDRFTNAYHSGDITNAPNGASEFIDIDIDTALSQGYRYVSMNVYVYRGPSFKDHKEVFVGWMGRKKPNSNEIYKPSTVEQKIDLTSDDNSCIPVVFDLKERKAIYIDNSFSSSGGDVFSKQWGESKFSVVWNGGNNIEANYAKTEDMIKFFTNRNNKMTLEELFLLHATSRGVLVSNRKDADVVFAFDGDITPYDINTINSEYVG